MENNICEWCGCNLEVERELFGGDKLFTGHSCKGQTFLPRISSSIWGVQYAYWIFLESKIVSIKALMEDYAPLPEIFIWEN